METRAERYRQRANELRSIAATLNDDPARATLIEIAEDYERMAATAEKPPARNGAGIRPDGIDGDKRPR